MFASRICRLALALLFLTALATAQNSWEDKNHAGEKAFQEGRLSDANRLFNEALTEAQQFGPKDVRLAPIYNNLALVAFVQNNFIASESLYGKAIALIEAARGPEDVLLLPVLDNLTRLYVKQWAFGKAIAASWRVCRIREKKLGADNPETTASLNKLATLYLDSVRLLPHDSSDHSPSASPSGTNAATAENADALDDSAKLAKAESIFRLVLAAQEKSFGAENARNVDVLENLAEVLHAEGNPSEAEKLYARAIGIVEKSFAPDDLKLAEPLQQLAELKIEDGNNTDAEGLYQRALAIDEKRLGASDPSLRDLLLRYSALLEQMQKPDEAKKLADRAAALPDPRAKAAVTPLSQTASVPYVLRFEKSVSDRYSGTHQMCLLVRADGRFRVEDFQRQGNDSGSVMVPTQKSPDGMSDLSDPTDTLDTRTKLIGRAPSVFESSVDPGNLQQLRAILSASEIRRIQGSFPQKEQTNYYGGEKISLSILRDDSVQNFLFPDISARQPYENSLKPLLKWLNATEKHKGSVIKGAIANSCSPELPQAVPMVFNARRGTPSNTATKAATQPPGSSTPSSQTPTFKVDVNLVLVRVVVRDAQGHAVGTLHQEDFRLLDNRKPQVISKFSLEQSASRVEPPATSTQSSEAAKPTSSNAAAARNIAYLFDDLHLENADLQRSRAAADQQISSLPPESRAAIFTSSGQTTLHFTSDPIQLHDTLLKIQPQKSHGSGGNDCPAIDPYMADLIRNQRDEDALGAATAEALVCAYGNDVRFGAAAEKLAQVTAMQQLESADVQTRQMLQALLAALRQLAATRGQHTLVLVSPGFIAPGHEQDFGQLIDRALHTDIVISTLDARGLYTVDSVTSPTRENMDYRRQGAGANAELLATLADSTGGTFFHNSNDMNDGFRRVAEAPEFYYVLGFSPAEQELDGKFHALTVVLSDKGKEKVTIQARKGYYAPKRPSK